MFVQGAAGGCAVRSRRQGAGAVVGGLQFCFCRAETQYARAAWVLYWEERKEKKREERRAWRSIIKSLEETEKNGICRRENQQRSEQGRD